MPYWACTLEVFFFLSFTRESCVSNSRCQKTWTKSKWCMYSAKWGVCKWV